VAQLDDGLNPASMRQTAEVESDGQEGKYLTFIIGEECYGMDIRHVTEIIGMQKITTMPDVPAFVKGVINLRGKVIPVMDARLRFSMLPRKYDDRTCIIVLSVGAHTIGLVVDTVSEVLDIPPDRIESVANFAGKQGRGYIKSLGKVGEDVKILLDAEKILHDNGETTDWQAGEPMAA
jgi:purine-binding chemotaxis protein CheW